MTAEEIEKELKMLDEHFNWGYMPYVEYERKKRELERRLEKEVNDG